MEDFAVRGKEPKDEVQIYTWKDATLRELTDLVISQFDLMCLHSIFFLPLLPFMLMVDSLTMFWEGQRSGSRLQGEEMPNSPSPLYSPTKTTVSKFKR